MCSSWLATIAGRTKTSMPWRRASLTKSGGESEEPSSAPSIGGLAPAWIEGDLTWYSGAAKRDMTKPKSVLLMHFFNHQTHHRGQVHCMLTQAGLKAHVSDLVGIPMG